MLRVHGAVVWSTFENLLGGPFLGKALGRNEDGVVLTKVAAIQRDERGLLGARGCRAHLLRRAAGDWWR
jgi:hypothetical protein